MSLFAEFSEPGWQRFGLTLIHSLWEGTAIAAGFALLVALARLREGVARYRASVLALLCVLACSLTTYFVIDVPGSPHAENSPNGSAGALSVLPPAERRRSGRWGARLSGAWTTGSGFRTIPAPPPNGVSSTVRCRSVVNARRSTTR